MTIFRCNFTALCVTPAKAGVQLLFWCIDTGKLDSRFRGNDDEGEHV